MLSPYPFLSEWKRAGLNKFPSVPFQPIVEYFIREFVDPTVGAEQEAPLLDDDFESRLMNRFREIRREVMKEHAGVSLRTLRSFDYEWWARALEPAIKNFIFEEAKRAHEEDLYHWGELVHEARKKVFYGADREETLKQLGREILPSIQGGKSLLTKIQLRTLKSVYLEMQDAIAAARKTAGLHPLGPDSGEADEVKRVFFTPAPSLEKSVFDSNEGKWLLSIFTKEEVKAIFSGITTANAAANIIAKRLNKVFSTRSISSRTLENRLGKIRPLLQ